MDAKMLPGRRHGQRGEGKFGAIIALVVVVGVAYLLIKIVPVRIATADFSDKVERLARDYTFAQITYPVMVDKIVAEAKARKLPVTEEDIKETQGPSTVRIDVEYDLVTKMIWGPWKSHYHVVKEIPRI